MPISASDAEIVKSSFAKVLLQRDAFSASLYRRLFDVAPAVRDLFSADMAAQREKLIATLALVIRCSSEFKSLRSIIEELGRAHVKYGAVPAHYEVLKAVLVETLKEYLADDFDGRAESAWSSLIDSVNETMIAGASQGDLTRS